MSNFQHTTISNGLTIVAEPDSAAHTAAIGFFVKTGARDEPAPLMGVSHFLEHMLFKGTPRRTAAQVNQEFDRMGANYNASTSHETTCYYAHVLPEFFTQATDLLCDILRPSLREEDFTMEKNVILEEIGMYADQPFWNVYEKATELFYGEHTLAHRVLGTNETITAMTCAQLKDYFTQRYSPDNIVVSLSGRFDFSESAKQIETLCGHWERTGATRDYTPLTTHVTDHAMQDDNTNMQYLLGLSPAPAAQDDDRYAAALLCEILGDSDNSRLYWELLEPGLADEVDVSHQPSDQTGSFFAYASCTPRNAKKVEKKLFAVLDRAAEKIAEEELQRAKSKIAMDLTLAHERPAGRMMAIGGQWLYLHRYQTQQETMQRIDDVSIKNLTDLMGKYPFSQRTVVRLSPTP